MAISGIGRLIGEDLLDLPGPRRLFEKLRKSISSGRSALLACPSKSMPPPLGTTLSNWVAGGREVAQIPAGSMPDLDRSKPPGIGAVTLASWLSEFLGLHVADGAPVTPQSLASTPDLGRRVIVADLRRESVVVQASFLAFARGFSDATKSVEVRDRSTLLLVVDGVSPSIIGEPDVTLDILWWWGTLGPLDAGVLLDRHGLTDPVTAAVALEVGSWDLDLVLRVADNWDGDLAELEHRLGTVEVQETQGDRLARADGALAGQRPGDDLIDCWRSGLVESWTGRSRPHVAAAGEGRQREIQRRVWLGQLREVFVVLELERRRITEWLHREALTQGQPAWLLAEDGISQIAIEDLELGQVGAYLGQNPMMSLPRTRREALRHLRAARNKLAHGVPLDGQVLLDLRRACAADGGTSFAS